MSSANNLNAAVFDDPGRAQALVERLIESVSRLGVNRTPPHVRKY